MNELLISWQFIETVLISLAIGALMGMEREHTKHQEMVGVRTFALVALLGALFVFFAEATGSNIQVFLGFASITLFAVILYAGNLFKFKAVGLTTSIALLIAYGMGTLVAYGLYSQAIFVTITVTIVLFAKQRLHSFVDKVSDKELLDFLEFLAIVGIIYPLIPTEPIAFLGAQIDLFAVWMLVVLISLINLFGFIGSRYFSAQHEVGFMALLGGLVSSTATALSMPSTFKGAKKNLVSSAYLIMSGSTFIRNLIIVVIFAPIAARYIVLPVAACSAVLIGLGFYKLNKTGKLPRIKVTSPFKVPKAIELSLKLFIIMVVLEVLQAHLPQVFYIATILGGVISSASTVATVALLASAGKVSAFTAAIAVSLALLAAFVIGHPLALKIAGAGKAAKSIMPYVIGIAALYCVLFFAMTLVI